MRVIGLAGWSGAGKTTLLMRLIPLLKAQGLTVSTVKNAHHGFDLDRPGKDSHNHRLAGANEVLVSSANRWALMHELRGAPEPSLADLLPKLAPVDLVLVEGFRRSDLPKIEVHRAANGKPFLHPDDPGVLAVITDVPGPAISLPSVHLDDIEAAAALVTAHSAPLDEALARLAASRG